MTSICYIDESGCPGSLPTANSSIQPAFVISGLIIDSEKIQPLTKEFMLLKRTFFPGKFSGLTHDLGALPIEIKGSDLRNDIRGKNKQKREHAYRFLDRVIDLMVKHDMKIISHIWVKGIGITFDGRAVYTSTTQRIAAAFQNYLASNNRRGIILADFREPRANSYISHSVFTQKYRKKRGGDPFPLIFELPSFGISDNHACLQIADLITSAILYPMATHCFCTGFVTNVHVNHKDKYIKQRFQKRIHGLQYNYKVGEKKKFGIVVSDYHASKTSWHLFN